MLRIDDIPQQVADDIQGYALIYLQKCDIINSTINKNLAEGKNNGIVELVKKQV